MQPSTKGSCESSESIQIHSMQDDTGHGAGIARLGVLWQCFFYFSEGASFALYLASSTSLALTVLLAEGTIATQPSCWFLRLQDTAC